MSKALATIATQPLIVAKVGLQSKPPPQRQGKPFKGFIEVMQFIVKHEGLSSLFKGIGPQIIKGLLVQGLLMMTKERYVLKLDHICALDLDILTTSRMELMFVLLFRYVRKLRSEQLAKAAQLAAAAASKAKVAVPIAIK